MSDGPSVFSDEARGVVSPEERDRLTKALGVLQELMRQTRLRLEGFSLAQVQDVMGIDERTARKRLRLIEKTIARRAQNRR